MVPQQSQEWSLKIEPEKALSSQVWPQTKQKQKLADNVNCFLREVSIHIFCLFYDWDGYFSVDELYEVFLIDKL